MAGVKITREFAERAAAVIRRVENTLPAAGAIPKRVIRSRDRIAVVLDEALDVATHAMTGATSALATICVWSTEDQQYTETDQQETVWNHSESDSYEVDTFGFMIEVDSGHWWFMGDCGPMASR